VGSELRLTLTPTSAAELPAWREIWQSLEASSDRPSLYTSYDWLSAWAQVIGAPRLLLLRAVDADDRTVALALAETDRLRNVRFAGGDLTPTRRPLCEPGSVSPTWRALSGWLRDHPGAWSTFAATGVGAEAEALPAAEVDRMDGTYLVLPASFDEHLARLSERNRNEVRRRLRRSQESGAALRRVPADRVDAALGDFLSFHRRRAAEAGIATAVDERALVLLRAATSGDAELDVLRGGDRVAVGINVLYRDVMFPYAIGWAPDASSLAPGILLTIDTVTESLRRGLHAVDMGPGAQKYKLSLGFDVVAHHVVHATNPSIPGRSYRAVGRLAAYARAARDRATRSAGRRT
jgi:CelD/BcsL family acetyltransferase involved in cellulose biosynthesis